MAVGEYLGSGYDAGTVLGRSSTDKIGFYGLATPIVQRSGSAMVTLATTLSTADSGVQFGSITGANAVISQITEIRDTLVALGLHAGS